VLGINTTAVNPVLVQKGIISKLPAPVTVALNFRYCIAGEYQTNYSTCVSCPVNTYSLVADST
jgi:hypothetical protein